MKTAIIQPSRKLSTTATQIARKPHKLSKLGLWRRENKGGIIMVVDRRAVNK